MQVGKIYKGILALLSLVCLLPTANAKENDTAHAVVFMYHRFGEQALPSTNIRVEQFFQQLNYLERNKFNVWPLEKIVKHLQQKKPLPDKTVAITIDDAYLSVFQIAFPILRQRGYPFTLFVSTDPLDKNYKGYMNWNELRMLAANGVSIGNHSAGHDHMIRQPGESEADWDTRVRADIEKSQKRFKEELKLEPTLFAYPYGEYSVALADILDEKGFVSFGQQSGAIGFNSDPRFYARYPIAEAFADLNEFSFKALSYPLDIENAQPVEPVIKDGAIPVFQGTLPKTLKRSSEIQCYASGQGKMPFTWIDKEKRQFEIKAKASFNSRRFRYNCTVPSMQRKRFYWFSHLWIQPGLAEE